MPDDGIIRSRVLPGLQFRLTDLLTQPEPKAMVRDPVYADLVLPEWREAELRAEAQTQARQESSDSGSEVEIASITPCGTGPDPPVARPVSLVAPHRGITAFLKQRSLGVKCRRASA